MQYSISSFSYCCISGVNSWRLASAQISAAESAAPACLTCLFDLPPALPADLMANKQVISHYLSILTVVISNSPSCLCTFMVSPTLMPPAWLRKCWADAQWPSDLCLLLMLRKAFFWSGIFSVFRFFFRSNAALLASDTYMVIFSCTCIEQRGERMSPASINWSAICSSQGAALPVRWRCG